jgi:hypothetical protein
MDSLSLRSDHMSVVVKTVASAEDFVSHTGLDGVLVTFTDQSFVFWVVSGDKDATRIKALTGETITICLETDDFPDYWVSTDIH